ncbi:MAG: pitrilysin family protein [Patescibacteria group bacterium]
MKKINFKIQALANGLDVIMAPIIGTKAVTVLIIFGTGSKFENQKNSGISHFLEHLLFKGTKKRPNTLAIAGKLDEIGAEYNAFTSKEYTGYWIKAEADQLNLVLDVLSDIILNSKFSKEEIDREKDVIIEELNMYLDNPMFYIEDLFEQCLYGDTPAGRDTIGTKETILKLNRKQILDYVKTQYSADQATICLAGKVNPLAIQSVNKYFNKLLKRNYHGKLKTKDEQDQPQLNLFYKQTDQAHLSLGVRTSAYAHQDELTTKIISIILGGSMSSRLFIKLRERNGLAYYVRTHNEPYTDSGYLTTQAGVHSDKLEQAIKIILNEYKILTTEYIDKTELNRVKQCLIGRTALYLESSDNMANWYARQMILFKEQNRQEEILTPEKYYARIKKINVQEINEVAKKIFVNNKLNLAIIGPYKKKEGFKKILKFD